MAAPEHQDVIRFFEHWNGIGREDSCFTPQKTSRSNDLVDDVASYMLVDSRQNVVKDVDIGSCVHGPRKLKACFLASTERYSFLTNFGPVSIRQNRQIFNQGTCFESAVVELGIEAVSEQNVVFDLDERQLVI